MKKLFFSSIIIFILFGKLFAQTDPARDEQNIIFQYIDKAQIPSGYLDEYGPQVVDKYWLNGVLADSNWIYNIELFQYLYNDIENAKLYDYAPAISPLTSVNTAISQLNTKTSTPLVFLTGQYSTLREDAIQQNLFSYNNNQIFDVQGRSESPYILQNVFAASPVKEIAPQINTISLTYNPDLSYSNCNKAISQIWIDFLDGVGYRGVPPNGSVSKTYTDASGYKQFAVKVLYTDNTYNYCYNGQYVKVANIAARYASFTSFDIDNPTKIIDAVPGQHEAGKIYVRYSSIRNGTPLQGKMIKPLIIVEGYDIHDVAPELKEKNYDVNDLLDEWNKIPQAIGDFDFNKALDETSGYDLVFIDYYTMDYIQNNAIMLEKAIQWVNGEKVAGSSQQNVVMGISLGGQVARYALAKMTKELGTPSTQTRLLLTHDSPHQGANVPLGLQHFLYDFGEAKIVKPIKDVTDQLKQFYLLNEQPATQQLLIARVTDANGGVAYNSFLAGGYRTMITFNDNDPKPSYEFKATTQGSQCSRYVMQPGTLLTYKDGNIATANFLLFAFRNKYKLTIQLNALPDYGTSAQISYIKMERNIRLFFGFIGTGWKTTYEKTRYSPNNIIPWDCVPGGTRSASSSSGSFSQNSTTPDPFSSHNTFFGNVWRFLVFPLFNTHSYLDIPFQQDAFTFVPLSSSLDIQNTTLSTFNQSYIFPVNGTSGSTAVKYIGQEEFTGTVNNTSATLYNLTHTDFTKRNSQWIYSEMENQVFNDCFATCNNFTIDGNDKICTSEIYTVSNVPSGSTVTWSASPSGIVNIPNPNGSQTTVNYVSNGNVTITATIVNPCTISTVAVKSVTVGSNLSSMSIYGPTYVSCNDIARYFTSDIPGLSYEWSYPGSWTYLSGQYSSSIGFQIPSYPYSSTSGTVSVTIRDACSSTTLSTYVSSSCGGGYYYGVSPNPATSTVTVSSKQTVKGQNGVKTITELNIYDQQGNLKKHQKFAKANQATINVSVLQTGVYFIEIVDGIYKEKQQLSVLR